MLPPDTPDRPLRNPAEVQALLAESINQVRRGQLDPHVANAVGYLAQVMLKAGDQHALEQRLARLESVFAVQQEGTTPDCAFGFEFVSGEQS